MTKEENDVNWDAYFIPGTNVLKNKLNISNYDELMEKEKEISFIKNVELYETPIDLGFKEEHLRAIHRYLFGDIYYFAGENRNVYMQKNNSYFSGVEDINRQMNGLFQVMDEEIKNVRDMYSFASFLSTIYIQLLHIHPFREGNGRTIREFIREYANAKSRELPFGEVEFSWDNVDKKTLNDGIGFALAFRSAIDNEFLKALIPIKNENIGRYN